MGEGGKRSLVLLLWNILVLNLKWDWRTFWSKKIIGWWYSLLKIWRLAFPYKYWYTWWLLNCLLVIIMSKLHVLFWLQWNIYLILWSLLLYACDRWGCLWYNSTFFSLITWWESICQSWGSIFPKKW